MSIKSEYIKTDVGVIRYLKNTDRSNLPTIFIHGFMGSANSWDQVINSNFCNTIAIDIPGHRKSHFTNLDDNSVDKWSDSMKQLIISKKLTRVNMCGYSMGGRLAIAFASRYPNVINKLILESCSCGIDKDDKRKLRYQQDLDNCRRIETDFSGFVDAWESNPMFLNQEHRNKSGYIAQREERLSHIPTQISQSLKVFGQGSMKSYDNEFSKFNFPIHLINGTEDKKYLAIADKMKDQNKNVVIHRVEAGHNIHLERPNMFIDILKDILNSN